MEFLEDIEHRYYSIQNFVNMHGELRVSVLLENHETTT